MNKNRVYNTKKNSKLASINLSRSNSKGIGKPFIIALITIVSLILISLVLLYQEEIVGKAFEVAKVNSAGVPKNLPPFSNLAQINIPVRANIGNAARTTAIRFVMSIKRPNGNLILCSDTDAPTLVNRLPWGQASSAATPRDAGMAATVADPLATSISRIVCSGTQWVFEYATLSFDQAQPSTVGQPIDIAQFQFSACLAPGTYTFSASEFTIVDNRNVDPSQPAPVVVIPIVATEDTTVIVNAAGSCPAAPACIPLQGLVSEWSGESLVGTQLGDRVGGNIGTAIGVVTRVTDNIVPRGQVLNFGGTDADYVRVPDSPSLQITGDFSVGAWIKTSSPKPIQAILSKVTTSPVQEGYILALGDKQGQRNDGKPCLWLSSDAGWVCGTRVINDGNWYHVVAVRQGALISIFVDGVLSNSGNKPVRANFLTNNEILKIGGSTPGQLREFVGRIDEAIYVNRALTDAEIQRIYRSGVCVSCTSRPSTACTQGVDCPGSTVISATGCTIAGQTCQGTPLTCQCPAGQILCGAVPNQRCVNLQTDNSNCGACGNACAVGQRCGGGICSCTRNSECRNPTPICASYLCRSCTSGECGVGLTCVSGSCVAAAPPAPSCAPVGTTNSQITPCLPAVAPTVSNTRRVLVASCPASPAACTYLCNTGLVPNADRTSCVSCASVVPANSQTGLCPGAAIPAAANTARVLVPSCPVDPLPNSVAACTYPCNRGFVPNADRTSCVAGGACGAANAACTRPCFTGSTCDPIGAVCQGGTLQPAGTACTLAGGAGSCNAAGACIVTCPAGQILCGAVPNQRCVNTQTDAANCGACGTACPVGQSCRGGLCALASCGNGQLDINEECDLSVVSTAGRFTINSCAGVNNRFTGGTLGCRANCLYDTSICTSPPPPPPASSGGGGGGGGGHCVAEWQCTPWSYCNKELKQTRTCTDVDPRCSNRPKTETRDCPACEVSWTCGLYSQCINGQETRSCWDEHECGTAASRTPSPMPQLSKSCVIPVEPSSGGFLPPPPVFQPPVVQKLSPFQKYKVPIIVGGGAAAVGLPALFYLLFKRRKKKVYNLDELKGWIRKEREIGTSNNDIIQILKEQTGWNHKEIMGAFESLRQESLESESSPVQEVEEES